MGIFQKRHNSDSCLSCIVTLTLAQAEILLLVTTCKTKTDFLLIEVFGKLFNTQYYGHQVFDPWWPFL